MKRKILRLFRPFLKILNKITLERYFQSDKAVDEIGEKRVLLLAPHVDDETIGAGGTLRKYSNQGSETSVIFLTDGSSSNSKEKQEKLIMGRKQEAKTVQKILNIKNIDFFDQKDGQLSNTPELQNKLKEKIELLRPEVIYAPVFVDCHPDHVITTKILSDTLKKVDTSYTEKLIIRLYEINTHLPVEETNFIVDISDYYGTKKRAIEVFKSQAIDFDGFLDLNLYKRKQVSDPSVKAVETFLTLTPDELEKRIEVNSKTIVYSRHLKQVNKSETLLYAIFKNLKWKKSIYKKSTDQIRNKA